jgi:Methyltransferase domain
MQKAVHHIDLDYAVRPRCRDLSASPHIKRLIFTLERSRAAYRETLHQFGALEPKLIEIPMEQKGSEPFWINGYIPGLDGISLYGFVAQRRPNIYFEVGSGNSTKFVRRAIKDFGLSTKIVSVDPEPRAEVNAICDEIHRVPFEDLDLSLLDELGPTDVMFVDNSHRAFANSDVTVFFMEALGRLPKGLLYGLHDIWLPQDYREDYGQHFYNEQYMLAAYLFGGADGDKVVLPVCYISHNQELRGALDNIWKHPTLEGIEPYGGAFWMEKG